MKSLHKKIGAIVLSGVIIGGFSGNVAKVYANYVIDPSSGLHVPIIDLNERFNPELYPKKYPVLNVDSQYVYKINNPKDVLPRGDNSGIDKVYKALNASGFLFIKVSGVRSEIDEFVEDINVDILKKPQLCFKNIDKFREYIVSLKYNEKPEEGVYRFMIGGFEGLFYFNPSKFLNMYDDPMINLRYIQRGENKYKYKVLSYDLNGIPPIKKYKKPVQFGSVEEFFDKMDLVKRQRPGYFGDINHGGVHEGGIYCFQIGDLVVLFRALA